METISFPICFEAITGHPPFLWQERLYRRLLTGDIPALCDLPTGLGKTSVIPLWLLALAEQVSQPGTSLTLPRRLVYIVDRRVVVDQATTEAENLLQALCNAKDATLRTVADALCNLSAVVQPNGQPFALSTLRGQFADNRAWSHDPARPAIIVGTVDMIGSRLLFSGYGGLRRYGRSQHAALLGQDALVVLDEAQLAPAFLKTLLAIEQLACPERNELARPFALMSLTATQPPQSPPAQPSSLFLPMTRQPLALEPTDLLQEETVRQRVEARKTLRFAPPDGSLTGKADDVLAQCMAKEAFDLAATGDAVVVFVNTVTALEKIHAFLRVAHGVSDDQCLRFNGQMRGHERDEAFADQSTAPVNQIFQAFRQPRPRAGRGHPVFLLATSAGEVGVNFDADHAVCDLVTLERMAQRLGRVNRAGDGDAKITVFLPADLPKLDDKPLQKTAELLARLPPTLDADGMPIPNQHSASPADLRVILNDPDSSFAFTPTSDPPPLDSARLDDWSLTSLPPDAFPRPQVSYWLRGITPDDDQAVTQLVWREEMRYTPDKQDAADLAKTRPPLPREIVQVPTYRAVKWLLSRAKKHLGVRKHKSDPLHGGYAAVRTSTGEWEGWPLTHFEDKDEFEPAIFGATIILPSTFGGLTLQGFLDEAIDENVPDVLEKPLASTSAADSQPLHRALLHGSPNSGWKAFDLLAGPTSEPLAKEDTYPLIVKTLAKHFQKNSDQCYRLQSRENEPPVSAGSGDGEAFFPFYRTEYFVAARAYKGQGEVDLEEHLAEARRCAEGIVARLGLPPSIQDAIVLAAAWHDLGKRREKWQRAIGNAKPGLFLAKSAGSYYDRSEVEGYRHEFGSLMDALNLKKEELQAQPESDLILHLIAAHHGHARPGFTERAYDVPQYLQLECAAAAAEAELRFDRLQRRFGWWGLAYLEALVKCADGIASDRAANPPGKTSLPSTPTSSEQPELFSKP